ncbi:TetR/AcrR family transcriptional regulator [Aeromicrobium alkaliterrae]|uniref:TetR/AcrR family transcriptional regulator n=1 Tax=Aeromicrobium alkaliterrae TaxID=302168 RepID=A0ABN2K705_9ACTN
MPATPGPPRTYGGVPEAERRTDRRDRLVAAALDLVGSDGVVALTVGSVCSQAGVAKRYFYESFASMDDLLSATLQEVFDRVGAAVASTSLEAGATARDLLVAAVGGAIDAMDDPRIARLYLESAGNAALLATRDRAVDGFVDQLLALVAGGGELRPSDQVTGHLLVSGATHVVALWLQGRLDLSRDELVAHMVDLGVQAADGIGGQPPA